MNNLTIVDLHQEEALSSSDMGKVTGGDNLNSSLADGLMVTGVTFALWSSTIESEKDQKTS